ncbi:MULTISPECIES: ribonuclease H family protein [unclassified Microbacterium]|uniref:ribonuclease H family protein n=1 Tax=unclassified Microbacterium TaxID=2609290 RepID=UPI00097F1736|nr:ribonuclease H [Microbacterium sp. JB110]RCS62797.1 ribonuclease HI [Microbacterium sp. JB110]SJM62596.1 Ribonuclease HI [Frigoribacterium sp. JB110]
MTITAAADGSALGNPGPMGWAWFIDDASWAAGGSPHGTNNQGELLAVLELLRATAGTDEALHIECDSKYVIDSVTRWMPGWKRKGWRKADGKPVLNRDILEALDTEITGRSVTFEWVKGHAGHPRNEAADKRANGAAQAYRNRSAVDAGPGFAGHDAEAPSPAAPPAASDPTRTSGAVAVEQPTLFDDLDDDATEIRITLTASEHARLRERASTAGISPEQFLRELI